MLWNRRVITNSFNNKFLNLDGVKLYNCEHWEGNGVSNSLPKLQLFLIFQMNLLNSFFCFPGYHWEIFLKYLFFNHSACCCLRGFQKNVDSFHSYLCFIWIWNHRIAKVRKALQDHLVKLSTFHHYFPTRPCPLVQHQNVFWTPPGTVT